MLFNSIEFFIFLPIVFILYWAVFNKNIFWQNGLILVASYFFYGWWSWKFMAMLFLSTLLDYAYGFCVASRNRKRAKFFLWLSIFNNLGILFLFKYYDFFAVQFQRSLDLIGVHYEPAILQLILPIGISFYTFHGMSYIFDIYRGKQLPIANFIDYAVFVSFFPLLVAGPIERASHLLPQIQKSRFFKYDNAVQGCRLILWGMFKKVVIADSISLIVDQIFNSYTHQDGVTLFVGAIAFSFQIYGDFSGYSDIAIGTAKLFGFELLSNFRFPYFSRDVAEFWRRWHISLSSWFRDYLYIPLGGSKNGKLRAVRNTFIIFLVSGFWHGASWNFIIWGLIHACGFLPLLLFDRHRHFVSDVVAKNSILPGGRELLQMTSTFLFVSFSWIFFRSQGIQAAFGYIKQMSMSLLNEPSIIFNPNYLLKWKMAFVYIAVLLIGDWYLRRDERNLKVTKNKKLNYLLYFLLSFICFYYLDFFSSKKIDFIYFQF